MPLYSLNKNKLSYITEKPFKLEKDIQKLCEDNMEQLLGLQFVRTEFALGKFKIDSLAFDPESKAFVIIEYKKVKSFSVVDQGYAYLALMLNNKADFILEYNESEICKGTLKKKDVDWSQSRVIFISPYFSKYQKETVNFKDLPIELWEIKKYSNDTVNFSQITADGAAESIKTVSKADSPIEKVSKEVKVYTEEMHLEGINDEVRETYEKYRNYILDISDDVEMKPKKMYIAFISRTNFVDFIIQKSSLKIDLNVKKGQLVEPKGITKDVSKIGHFGNGDYEIKITDESNFKYITGLIEQAYELNS